MPMYEYQCQKCGTVIERIVRSGDKPPKKCEECGGKLAKLVSAPAFQFKGSGWYVTDYGKGNGGGKPSKGDSDSGSSDGASASGDKSSSSSDKKSEKKSDKKSDKKKAKAD